MSFRIALCVYVSLAMVSLRAQDANKDFGRLMEQGRVSETDNRLTALQCYLAAADLAKRENLPQAEAEAALNAGRIVEALYASEPNQLGQALALYQEAGNQGDAEQKQIAFNNLGVLYLKLNKTQEAMQSFQRIDFAVPGLSMAYLLRYNYGRALERNERPGKAYEQYKIAAELAPFYSPAASRGAELAPSVGAVAELCEGLIESARENSLDCLHRALQKFAERDEGGILLPLLVRSYVALGFNRDKFESGEALLLFNIGRRAPSSSRSGFESIREAFKADFEKSSFDDSSSRISWWREPGRNMPFSSLLETLAEEDEKEGRLHQAMGRYVDAWSVNPRNLEAATRYISLANDEGKPGKATQFIDRLIAYQFLKSNSENEASDDTTMLGLHIALGVALEHSSPCRSGDDGKDPRLSLFHWLQAEQAETRLRAQDPAFPLSFVLYKHLAGCFRDSDDATYANYKKKQTDAYRGYRSLYRSSDKFTYHLHSIVYPAAALRIGAHAGLNQWRDDPRQWGQGAAGFGRRYGSSFAVRSIRQMIAFGLDAGLGEDPHFIRLGRSGTKARTISVLRQTLVTYNSKGDYTFAFWRAGSAYGSELVSNSWRPRGYNTAGDALVRGTFTLAGDTGANALKEFLPDFKRVKGLHWIASAAAWFLQ